MSQVTHHLFNEPWLELTKIGSLTLFSKHAYVLTIAAFVTVFLIFMLWRRYSTSSSLVPGGFFTQSMEMFITYVKENMVYEIMDEEEGKRYLPFILTLFLLLLVCNFLGLLPSVPSGTGVDIYPSASVTGNFSVNLALASFVLVFGALEGIRHKGLLEYLGNFTPHGMPWWLFPLTLFIGAIEILGTLIRHTVLALRLLANMFAGHAVLFGILWMAHQNVVASRSFLGGLIGAVGPLILGIGIYVIEILVAVIQAYVFTILSVIFIDMQIAGH